jgi:beta-lactamase class A
MSRSKHQTRQLRAGAVGLACLLAAGGACAAPKSQGASASAALQAALVARASSANGSLGACVVADDAVGCVNGDKAYPMQSVFKLVVAIGALDAVDTGRLSLDQRVLIRPEDLSVYVQPLAQKVGPDGYRASIREMIIAAVAQSDSLASDILLEQIGGPAGLKMLLDRKRVTGVRVDRDERRLASEVAGLRWEPRFADPATFRAAIAALPDETRDAAFAAYRADPRDRATPRGMAELLRRLAAGDILSPDSTAFLLEVMGGTQTFPDRLRAGAPPGWWVGHKTGTSDSWKGVNAVTADVGLMRRPDGKYVAVTAFVADSTAPMSERNAVIADVARIAGTAGAPPSPGRAMR